jgi:hypothetical protein
MEVRFLPRGQTSIASLDTRARATGHARGESNGGAMPSQQARPRAGAQPELAGSEREARPIPPEGTQIQIVDAEHYF